MSRHLYFLAAVMVVFLFSTPSSGQRDQIRPTPRRNLPGNVPEVVIAPGQSTPELDNTDLRVSRVRIPAKSALSNFASPKGLLVAVTEVNIMVRTVQGPARGIRLTPGQTYWIDAATTFAANLGPECEFIYVQVKR